MLSRSRFVAPGLLPRVAFLLLGDAACAGNSDIRPGTELAGNQGRKCRQRRSDS